MKAIDEENVAELHLVISKVPASVLHVNLAKSEFQANKSLM
jgi:hypothetical protein